MNRQMNDDDRIDKSDYIIINDGTTPLLPQVKKLDKILRDGNN
jgi:dephospho-CoA kinase